MCNAVQIERELDQANNNETVAPIFAVANNKKKELWHIP
jgi:hypothetical protein